MTRTPDVILEEILATRRELMRGPDAVAELEVAAERAEDAAQLAFDAALMSVEGSIPEKQALARLASQDARDQAFVARAAFNRARSKTRGLEASLVSLQAELKWAREAGA